MKKSLFLTGLSLVFLTGVFTHLFANEIVYGDSWGKAGFTLEQSGINGANINFSVTRFALVNKQINGETMQSIQLPGAFLPNDQGKPNLPGLSRYLAIPQGATVQITITSSRKETFTGINLEPAPRIPFETENGPLNYHKDQTIYTKDAFYPDQIIRISSNKRMRGVDVILVGIMPFQYNPVTKKLIVYRDLKVKLTFGGGNGIFGRERLRSLSWEPILNDLLLNYKDLPKVSFKLRSPPAHTNSVSGLNGTRTVENVEYLIIVPDDPVFKAWGDSIRIFRNEQGIKSGVVTTTEVGGNTFDAIQDYVDNAYYNWDTPPSAVLLLADYGNSGSTITSSPDKTHPYSGTYITDNDFADVDGDHLPDIVFARITARNADELENTVGKMLNYERHPSTNPDFYNHPVTAMGWQTERWFQLCSEIIAGFFDHKLGKAPVRENSIYSGGPDDGWSTADNTETIVDYFGPNGLGYIPQTPDYLTDFGGNATRINADINSGAFLVQHRDHGSETGWGEPSYSNSDLSGLHNDDLPFVFSINCLTGEFNWSSECFVEAFHRYPQRALGLIGATQVSYSFVNDTYAWGMYDNMWPEFMPDETTTFPTRFIRPAFANAAGKYFLQQSDWPSNPGDKEITYDLFHAHGGAYTCIYSEMPQNLTVTHNSVLESGATSFSVTADEGSLIGLSVNGELIGVGEGTGEPVSISIPAQQPGDTMLVTATKQNYYRYSSEVQVVSSSGPYVTVDSYSIDDNSTGNGNGQTEFDESVLLNVAAKNLGSDTAFAVTGVLSSTDTYLNITDSTHFYGDIDTNQTVAGNDAFAFTAVNNAPDQHSASCQVKFTDRQNTEWVSNIAIKINAPVFEIGSLTIDDSQANNDGGLDPGETADAHIQTMNTGHAGAPATTSTLVSLTSGVTVNTANYDFGVFAANDTNDAVFSLSAASSMAMGTSAFLKYTVVSGAYSAVDTFEIIVGEVPTYNMADQTVQVDNALFYDSGGPDNDYSAREKFTSTFTGSDGSSALTVKFTSFDVGSGDELHIYDGATTNDPEISGSPFTGTTLPPQYTSTNPQAALTFYFTSNLLFNGAGWRAELNSEITLNSGTPAEEVIKEFALLPNYPNPFNPETQIRYRLAKQSFVELTVFNMLGQNVQTLVKRRQNAGSYSLKFKAENIPSGVYFYRLRAGGFNRVRKMILLR